MLEHMSKSERLVDWILNVWDDLSEETTYQEIVDDIQYILEDQKQAESFVAAWFKDHGTVLTAGVGVHPALKLTAYEQAVRDWVMYQLSDICEKKSGISFESMNILAADDYEEYGDDAP